MNLESVMKIASTGLSAQSVRLNTIASNLTNANTVAGSEESAYRSRQPVFQTVLAETLNIGSGNSTQVNGVRVSGIVNDQSPIQKLYNPGHPKADDKGYVYLPNVKPMEEMANMMDASNEYRNNLEMITTSRNLLMRTINMLGS